MQTPTYDNFQVAPNTLPQTRFNAQEMSDPGAGMMQQAKVSMALGQHYGEQALQQMMAANQSVADQKWVEVENYRLQLQQEYEQERGLNALNREGGLSLADEYNNKLNQFIADRAESLNNRAQVEMFAQRVGPTQADFSDGVTKHMMAEGRKFQEETLKGRMDVTVSGAVVAPTNQAFATSIARLEQNIGDAAAYYGWAPEKAQMELRAKVGEVVSQRANRLMDLGDYQQAQSMVEQYGQMMDGKAALDLQARISKFQLDDISAQQADQLYEAFKNDIPVDGSGVSGQSTPPAGKAGGSGNVRTYTMQGGGSFRKVGGSRSWRNNNPGNMEYGAFAKAHGAIGTDGRFAIFPTEEAGRLAKEALIFESNGGKRLPNNPLDYGAGIGYRDKTLTQMIAAYAPASENNTRAYQQRVLAAVGGRNKQMRDYTPAERKAIMQAMLVVEGWKEGRVEGAAGAAVAANAGGGRPGRLQKGGGGQATGNVAQPTVPVSRETRYAEYMRWIDENISNPVQREAVRRRFNERKGWDEKGEQEARENSTRMAQDFIASGGSPDRLPAAIQQALGPSGMQAMREYQFRLEKGQQDQMEYRSRPIYFGYLYQPEQLDGMSEQQIMNLSPVIGLDKANDLLNRKRQREKEGESSAPNVEATMVKQAMRLYGIPMGDNASQEDIQKRYWFQDNVRVANQNFYRVHGRYMTDGEMWQLITTTFSDKYVNEYISQGVLWNSTVREEVPALLSSGEQRSRMRYERGSK
nr:MAG TPA: virion protein [Caudoviricetes sp.]